MSSILETFYVLFQTDAKRVTKEAEDAQGAVDKLADSLDKVGDVDPTGAQAVAKGLGDAAETSGQLMANAEKASARLADAVDFLNKIDPKNAEAYGAALMTAQKAARDLGDALGLVGDQDAAQLNAMLAEAATALNEATTATTDLGAEVTRVDDAAVAAGESAATIRDNLEQTPPPVRELTDEMRHADRVAKGLGQTFVGWARQLTGPLAAFFSARAILRGIQDTFANINELTEQASRYNFNVEGYNAFNQIIEDLGGNAEDAERYVRRMSDTIRAAYGDASSDAAKALKSIKVSAADAKGDLKDTETVLLDLAGALEGVSRRVAIDRLRRLGIVDPAMIKLVLEGREQLEKLIKVEKAKGLVTAEMARRVREFKLAWDDAKDAMGTVFNQIAAALAGPLKAFADWITKSVIWMRENKFVVQGFAIGLAVSLGIVAAALWGSYIPAWAAAAVATVAATWPILAIIAAVLAAAAAFAVLYDDVQFFLKGQPSMIGELLAKYEWLRKAVDFIGAALRGAGNVAKDVWGAVAGAAEWAFNQISRVGGPVISLIIDLVKLFGAVFGTVLKVAGGWTIEFFKLLWSAAQPAFQLVGAMVEWMGGIFGRIAKAIWGEWGAMFDRFVQRLQAVIGLVRQLMGFVEGARGALDKMAPGSKPTTAPAVAQAQAQVSASRNAPLSAQTGASVSNRAQTVTKRTDVKVGKVEVHTAATDADGMARAAGGALSSELRRTTSNFDDGVDR